MTTALIAIAIAALMVGLVIDTPERRVRRARHRARLQLGRSLTNRRRR